MHEPLAARKGGKHGRIILNRPFRFFITRVTLRWKLIMLLLFILATRAPSIVMAAPDAPTGFDTLISNPSQIITEQSLSAIAGGGNYTDPAFNTTIRRLTNATGNSPITGYSFLTQEYSKIDIWNSNESVYLLEGPAVSGGVFFHMFNASTHSYIRTLTDVGGGGIELRWHPSDPNILNVVQGGRIRRLNVLTNTYTLLRDFTAQYTRVVTRGEGNWSRDNRYIALIGEDATGSAKDIFVYDASTNTARNKLVITPSMTTLPTSRPDWVSISPLGNYVIVNWGVSGTTRYTGVEVFDLDMNFLRQIYAAPGHSDYTVDTNGDEVYVVAGYGDPQATAHYLKKIRLSDGQLTNILRMDWYHGVHVSCRNINRPGWCYISTYETSAGINNGIQPFEDEILAVKLDGSGSVQRIAHHRSQVWQTGMGPIDYWATPRVTVNKDGTKLVFASNWRQNIGQSKIDAYLIDLSTSQAGIADTTPPTGSVIINSANIYTNSTTVILTLTSSDNGSGMGAGAQMAFSNDGVNWSAPEAFNTNKTWTLSADDGPKTVYVKIKDSAGNWATNAIYDSIILDTQSPGKPGKLVVK